MPVINLTYGDNNSDTVYKTFNTNAINYKTTTFYSVIKPYTVEYISLCRCVSDVNE